MGGRALVLVVVLPILLITGCSSGTPTAVAPQTSRSTTSRLPGQAATYRRLAAAEANRLIALASIPPGSTALPNPPTALTDGPAVGTEHSSLIDRARYLQVPLSPADAQSWIAAHPPAGLSRASTAPNYAAGGGVEGVGFAAPDGAAWTGAQLDISLTAGSAPISLWRIDGVVLAVDPVPIRDEPPGPRLRITVAGGCPPSDAGSVGVSNTGPGLDDAMLPSGAPVEALACSYDGANGHRYALHTHTSRVGRAAADLAAAARAVPLGHVDDLISNCPSSDGRATVVAFAYPGRRDVDLWYSSSGCASLRNGSVVAGPSARLSALGALFALRIAVIAGGAS